ncbi:MAG: ribosome biogenesis GTPase Der [Eubacteriales bacterium]|nr:ribosome biogenesis GTPase Der [Eubacteriales bacterium]MDD4717883.1 ribosome biogenesis GTPase Der [Eubacteriales bacterium]
MAMPLVAVVGRPNVGKSTFFNYLVGSRISIVDDIPGVTRDRIYSHAEWRDRSFAVVDTGGIEPASDDHILKSMREQAQIAIDTADVIVFMTDSRTGLTASDEAVAVMLRKARKPVVVAVNKVDTPGETPPEVYEFYNLGLGEVYPVSSTHGLGIGDLLDGIMEHFADESLSDDGKDVISVAFIGKPNAGKSSTVNKILGFERTIVSDIPGTTRDSIDSYLENEFGKFNLIDTAGLRRKGKVDPGVEKFSVIRSLAAIDRADVCVIIIDAEDNVTEQDTKIAGYAHNAGKACILCVNKWDMIDKGTGTLEDYEKGVRAAFAYMDYAPIVFISAKTGQRIDRLFEIIVRVHEQAGRRLSTGALNDLISRSVAMVPTPQDKGKHLKIYYGTQVGIKPPTFALFINKSELMHFSYERYLENQFRKTYGFEGTPIRFLLRPKDEHEIRKKGTSPVRKKRKEQ